MEQITVQGKEREQTGKGANRRLRAQGRLPAVLYGHGIESLAVSVEIRDVDQILRSKTGHNTIFKLAVGKTSSDVLIKDYQLDPIKGTLLNADFQTVSMDEKMTFSVPIQTQGTSVGVIAGGVLDLVLREISVECFPVELPDHIIIEVTDLDIGESIRVEDLNIDSSRINLLSAPELVVLSIVAPHVEKEPEEVALADEKDLLEEGADEPEVIKKGKEAGEETKDKEE